MTEEGMIVGSTIVPAAAVIVFEINFLLFILNFSEVNNQVKIYISFNNSKQRETASARGSILKT